MPKIIVDRTFSLRFDPDEPLREFGPGEHEITEEEFENWYIQASLEDGSMTLGLELTKFPKIEAETKPKANKKAGK